MAQIVSDLVADTTATTGTGAKTLANIAATLRRTLAGAGAVTGDTAYLRISHATLNEWEIGNYTYNSVGPTVTLIGSPLSSSNAGAAVNFSAGTKNVALVMPAAAMGVAQNITDTKVTPVDADKLILLDTEAADAAKITTVGGLRTRLANQIVGAALGTTGTVNLDMAALTGTIQTITASGNLTFTTSNRAAGRAFELRIDAGGAARTLAWPAGWVAFGAALPTSLASGKVLRVAVSCTGTTDASIDASSALSA